MFAWCLKFKNLPKFHMPEDNLKRRESTLHVGTGNFKTVVGLNYTYRGPFLKGKLEANKIFYSHIFDFIYQSIPGIPPLAIKSG